MRVSSTIFTEVRTMIIATALGLLALFSFVSILLSGDDELSEADPRDQLPAWARFGLR
jgi:predicted metal-dependent hydrolase